MIFNIETKIYGDRSVFGYFGKGEGFTSGNSSAFEALELLDEEYTEYEWKNLRWSGDTMIAEFEQKIEASQMIETVTLQPESYYEFVLLKDWEKTNGFF